MKKTDTRTGQCSQHDTMCHQLQPKDGACPPPPSTKHPGWVVVFFRGCGEKKAEGNKGRSIPTSPMKSIMLYSQSKIMMMC